MKYLILKKYQQGFTLIELLVVIAIIGILASVVLASLNTSRGSARDASRLTEVKQLQTALEIYRNSNDNQYPCANSVANNGGCGNTGAAAEVFFDGTNASSSQNQTFMGLINFNPGPDQFWGNTAGGAIRYRLDSTLGASNNGPVDRTSYSIIVRLENGRTNSSGVTINPNSWCSISVGTGHDSWNRVFNATNFPNCF